MSRQVVSVVIPCYNEKERILPVINEIKKSAYIAEIIVVDNHSDKPSQQILKKVKGIKLIIQPKNMGKANSQKVGLLHAKSKYIAFIDADLKNFTVKHFESLLRPVIYDRYDLALSDKEGEPLFNKLTGFSVACTGERVLKKELLLKNLDIFDNPGYLVEASMNAHFFGKTKIARVPLKKVGQYFKCEKIGAKGHFDDAKMLFEHLKCFGPKNFIFQLLTAKTLPVYQS